MTAPHLAGRLPAIGVVRRWSQSLAVLDAIMSAEREDRYFSYDTEFGPGQALASMRNGSGDEYSITFTGDGAFLRGFDHESPLSPFSRTPPALWPGILTGFARRARRCGSSRGRRRPCGSGCAAGYRGGPG